MTRPNAFLARSIRGVASRIGAIVCLVLAGACGWHTGLLPPEGASSVGVEIFATGEGLLERNLEPLLHDELSRAVADLVDAPLVSTGDADLVVRGRIIEYRRRGGIRSPEHVLLESGVRIVISGELVERTTGRIVRPTVQAHIWSGYVLGDPDAEAAARDRALRNLAETLVLDLFRPRMEDPEGEMNPEAGTE